MARSAVLGALLLVLANVSFCQAQTVTKYFKVGGTLQLSPQPVSAQIYSIVWKYDKNLLAEWVNNSIDLTYYSKFKGRTTLNTSTGVLEIRDMTAADPGLYSVEINNQVQSQVYQTVAIEDVPQPVVEVKPLVCSSTTRDCKLVCEGDVNRAGPVTYSWKKDDGAWETSKTNTMEIINDEETQRVETFTCRMKNLFSEKDSKAFKNPFYQEKPATETPSLGLGAIVAIAVFVIIIVVVVILLVLYFVCEPFKQMVEPCLPWNKRADAANAANAATDMNVSQKEENVPLNGADTPKQ